MITNFFYAFVALHFNFKPIFKLKILSNEKKVNFRSNVEDRLRYVEE